MKTKYKFIYRKLNGGYYSDGIHSKNIECYKDISIKDLKTTHIDILRENFDIASYIKGYFEDDLGHKEIEFFGLDHSQYSDKEIGRILRNTQELSNAEINKFCKIHNIYFCNYTPIYTSSCDDNPYPHLSDEELREEYGNTDFLYNYGD